MTDDSIKQGSAMTVAFLAMRGPYAQMPEAMGKLYGWIQARGWTPTGMPEAVYLTSPAEVPESDAVWEVWAPILGDAAEAGPDAEGLGVKTVPPTTLASTIYTGPYEDIGPAYEELMAWTAEQGYEMAGPPRELYLNDPNDSTPSEYQTEIQFPVVRKAPA